MAALECCIANYIPGGQTRMDQVPQINKTARDGMTALAHPVHLHVYFYVQEYLQRSCQTLAVHHPVSSFLIVMYQIIHPDTMSCMVCPQMPDSLVSRCTICIHHMAIVSFPKLTIPILLRSIIVT
jgi:hypothetical protein